MIRGNYSLAKEVRKNEQKSKQKIQTRQKHQHRLEQLSATDPIRLFLQLEKLEQVAERDQHQDKRLSKLRQDWEFIRKNKLHAEKVNSFLENKEKRKAAKEKEQRRLRGKDSVYFNPELNPLGKVPNTANLAADCGETLPNLAKPVKSIHVYEQDPLIEQLGIRPPQGSPPRFYKNVQNTNRNPGPVAQARHAKESTGAPIDYKSNSLDTDSDGQSSDS